MEDGELKRIVCDICCKAFHGENSLYNHKRHTHKQVGRFVCFSCKLFFEAEADLTIHNLVSHDTSFFICGRGMCKLQFKTKDELFTHLKEKYEATKPCEICAKKFKKGRGKSKLLHMAFEHKVGQLYICGACHDWYSDSVEGLIKHERSNKNHRQLTLPSTQPHVSLDGNSIFCKVCERKFEFVKTLVQHIRDKHGGILKNTEVSKRFKCNVCPKRFWSELGLNFHLRSGRHKEIKVLGKADLKMDIKIEIKLEQSVKDEYFEEEFDIKQEENCGDWVKTELTLDDTFKEEFIHNPFGTDNTIKSEDNSEDADSNTNNLALRTPKQTPYLVKPPQYLSSHYPNITSPQYPAIAPSQYSVISPPQCPTISPPQLPSITPSQQALKQYPIMPPVPLQYPVTAQYGYGYQNRYYGQAVNEYGQTQSDFNYWNQLSIQNCYYYNTGKLKRREKSAVRRQQF